MRERLHEQAIGAPEVHHRLWIAVCQLEHQRRARPELAGAPS